MPEGPQPAVAPLPVREAPQTVREAIASGSERLAAAGSETPRLDAELLLAAALGHESRARLVLDSEDDLYGGRLAAYERLLVRRERREPVAYILGYKWFRGIRVCVDPRVLIPRPESELLVEAALSLPLSPAHSDADVADAIAALETVHASLAG